MSLLNFSIHYSLQLADNAKVYAKIKQSMRRSDVVETSDSRLNLEDCLLIFALCSLHVEHINLTRDDYVFGTGLSKGLCHTCES